MKFHLSLIIAAILFFSISCCKNQTKSHVSLTPVQKIDSTAIDTSSNENDYYVPTDTITGDFNGDGRQEKCWMASTSSNGDNDTSNKCIDLCCYLVFSDKNIPPIKIQHCIGGQPVNHSDLNGDGADEIGILPEWINSCWWDYHVFSLRNNKWIDAVEPFETHCEQWGRGVIPIKKDKNKKGFAIIRYSDWCDTGIIIKEKIVRVNR